MKVWAINLFAEELWAKVVTDSQWHLPWLLSSCPIEYRPNFIHDGTENTEVGYHLYIRIN